MAKDIRLLNKKNPLFTKSTIRIAGLISIVMVLLYLLFNIFSFLILDYQLELTLDSKIDHEMEHIENAISFEKDSLILLNPKEFTESDLVELTDTPFLLHIYDTLGNILLESKNMALFTEIPVSLKKSYEWPFFENKTLKDENLRIGYNKIYNTDGKHVAYIQLATFKSAAQIIEYDILVFNLLSFPVFLVLIISISLFLAKKSYAPINKIVDIAKNISATNLSARLQFEAQSDDELGKLRDTLNDLFERLEKQINQIRNFTDNASHQLMSPLSILNSELEYIIKNEKLTARTEESLQILKKHTARMIHIIKTLLMMAREGTLQKEDNKIFNLSNLLKKDIKEICVKENITFEYQNDLYVKGSPDNFLLVIQNLIDNAVKYSNDSNTVIVKAFKKEREVFFIVEDQGIGIPDAEKEKIFNKFYRGNDSEKLGKDGFGLGLSLAQTIVRAMNGIVYVEDNQPRGSRFIVKLKALDVE